MGKWMSNINTINRAKDRGSKKGFATSRAEFVVGRWGQALGLRMIRKNDKDLDMKGLRVIVSNQRLVLLIIHHDLQP